MKNNKITNETGNATVNDCKNMVTQSKDGNFEIMPAGMKEDKGMKTVLNDIMVEFSKYVNTMQVNALLNEISIEAEKINQEFTFSVNIDNMKVGRQEQEYMSKIDNLSGVNVRELKERLDVMRYNKRMDSARRAIAGHRQTTLTEAEAAKLEKIQKLEKAWSDFLEKHPSLTRELKKPQENVSRETLGRAGSLSLAGTIMQAYGMSYREALDYLGEVYGGYKEYSIPCLERKFDNIELEYNSNRNEACLMLWYENNLFEVYTKSALRYLESAGRRTSATAQNIIAMNYKDLLFEDCVSAVTEIVMSWHCNDEGVYDANGQEHDMYYTIDPSTKWIKWRSFKTRRTKNKETHEVPYYYKLVNACERCFTEYSNPHVNYDYFEQVNAKLENKVNDVIDATFSSPDDMKFYEIESMDVWKHFMTFIRKYYPKYSDLEEFTDLDNAGLTYKEIEEYTAGRITERRCKYLTGKIDSLITSYAKECEMKETRRKQDAADKRKKTIEEKALKRAKALEAAGR